MTCLEFPWTNYAKTVILNSTVPPRSQRGIFILHYQYEKLTTWQVGQETADFCCLLSLLRHSVQKVCPHDNRSGEHDAVPVPCFLTSKHSTRPINWITCHHAGCIHFSNPRPLFAYSLYNFYWATMITKGFVLELFNVKAIFGRKFLASFKMGSSGGFQGNWGAKY